MKKTKSRIVAFALVLALAVCTAMPTFAAINLQENSDYLTRSPSSVQRLRINVVGNKRYLNVYGDTVTDMRDVTTYGTSTGDVTQRWCLYLGADYLMSLRSAESSLMYAVCSSAGNCIIRYIPYAGAEAVRLNIPTTNPTACLFSLYSGQGYLHENTSVPKSGGFNVEWASYGTAWQLTKV